jgi:hypothetical protein
MLSLHVVACHCRPCRSKISKPRLPRARNCSASSPVIVIHGSLQKKGTYMHTNTCIHKTLDKQSMSTGWHLAFILAKNQVVYIYIYIYIGKHIYRHIYIYHAARLSGYVVVAPKKHLEIKWHESLTSLRFVCLTWLNVCGSSDLFFAKQIGEFDWTWFHVQSFTSLYFSIDVQVGGHPTIASDPNIGLSPPTKLGERRGW